jgi:hypothetical protein
MSGTPAAANGYPILEGPVRVLVGATNFAGQGRAWAESVRRVLGVPALSYAVGESAITLAADHTETRDVFEDPERAGAREGWVQGFTHVLIEAGRPVTGITRGRYANGDYPFLLAQGLCVGMVAHGSDVRRPDRHMDREPDSPFFHSDAATLRIRQAYADLVAPLTDACPWAFVSTPDLLDDVPRARWLPVVIDVDRWDAPAWTPPPAGKPPRVLHVPSDAFMKGTEQIEPALHRLADAGRISYTPVRGVPQQEMPALIASADIVLDQFALGSYGVAAVEAMATGRAVVGHVRPEVRAHVLATTGHALPIVQSRAADVEATILGLLDDVDGWQESAEAGRRFALDVHDGWLSAQVLREFVELGRGQL